MKDENSQRVPAGARMHTARWISILGHPFVMTAIMVSASSMRFGSRAEAARTLGIVLLITVAPVALLMLLQVRRGKWENVDASNARERPILFAIGMAGLAALLGYLLIADPRSAAVRGTIGVLMMLAVCAVATKWIKVSLHMAFASLTAVLLILTAIKAGWLVLAFLPLLAWSRLVLMRHRPVELVIGTLIGLATALAIYGI